MSLDQPAWWFIAAAGMVTYTYVLYPLAMAFVARVSRVSGCMGNTTQAGSPASVSVVMAVHNEAGAIGRRLRELVDALNHSALPGEIVVVSDGSSDGTAEVTRTFRDPRVRLIERAERGGKAQALSEACEAATSEILVFADARQHWPVDSLRRLLGPFADPAVGATSGDLTLDDKAGDLAGVGLYWRYEKWLRRNESMVHSTVGVSGSIAAVRRSLFHPIPAGTILDDVYWPLQVVMRGYRVVHVEDAVAFDRLPSRPRDEFSRKVRTLSGNFQLVSLLPQVLLPWCNPIWLQFISHKLLRLVAPWALLVMLVAAGMSGITLLRWSFWIQIIVYGLGILGLSLDLGTLRARLSPIMSFMLLNAAAWVAFWVWVSGRTGGSWTKVSYQAPSPGPK